MALFLNGCVSTSQQPQPAIGLPTAASTSSSPSALELQIRSEVQKWVGTPHKMGGTDHSGVDCSGFVQRVYRDLFALQLPRTTAGQVKYGKKIQSKDLKAGDLVFFLPSRTVRHVGIYLGNGQFAHTSKTNGVMVSSLYEPYWQKAYWTARRVLPDQSY